MNDKEKVLVLFSGGLDSTLAIKAMLDQGLDVEAAIFRTPFCLCDKCHTESIVKKFELKAHTIFLGQEYLDLVSDPPRGYGSQMNPCIDCRILMMTKAKELANEIGAKCLVTGEVLNERPFSQTKRAMEFIEKKAGLEGKILRPLSAKLLPETEIEQTGVVNREKFYSIEGRRRLPQLELAREWGIKDYPCPSGGCLLTDPRFADKLRDYLKHEKKLKIDDIHLLRLGRHFRIKGKKIIVGRNEKENERLESMAKKKNWIHLEVIEYMSPITILKGNSYIDLIEKAAQITVRYSDAKKDKIIKVKVVEGNSIRVIKIVAANDEEIKKYQI